jgi:hypothetical protein
MTRIEDQKRIRAICVIREQITRRDRIQPAKIGD